ncbi:hypothetical protein Tagg_0703 [Thermosphaera aggregans DSM 11486]|uniref:Uncharacterized protein n=2 Tax=Thermosphaera aggregans TaxID=54254 RepID=D5U1H6_THEAM|nr:hypothetical protein Tagg_0703 [Thermosphaera aggregans DSM 11486]
MRVGMKRCFKVLRRRILLLAILNLLVIGISYNLPSFETGRYDFQINYDPSLWILRFRLVNITLFTTPSTQEVDIRLIIPGVLNETVASIDYIPGLLFYEPDALFEKSLEGLSASFSPNIDVRLDLGVPGYFPAIPTYAYHRRDGVWELRFQSPGYLDAYGELTLLMKDPVVSVRNNGGMPGIVRLLGKSSNSSSQLEIEVPPNGVATRVLEGEFTSIESITRLCLISHLLCFNCVKGVLYFVMRDNILLILIPLILGDLFYMFQACMRNIERVRRGTKKI